MLSNSHQTDYRSGISSPESVSSPQDYASDLRSQQPSPFPSIEDEESGSDENHSKSDKKNKILKERDELNLGDLTGENDFQEMLNRFFVVGHKKLLAIQIRIRNNRETDKHPLLNISYVETQSLQALREHCYKLQMVLFKTPKGRKYDSIL